MCYGMGAPGKGCATGWESPFQGFADPQLSWRKQTCPGSGGTPCQRQELMAPILQPTFTSPPLKNQALPAQGQQLEEFILCSMLNGYVQKCSGKEGVGGGRGGTAFVQRHPKRGSFSDALDSSHELPSAPSCPAGLERHQPSLERSRD